MGKVEANNTDVSHQRPQTGIPSKSRATTRPATQIVSTKTKAISMDSSFHPCKLLELAALPNGTPCIQDQMQEAYAADDMHLARILFLKTKGIEVTSDTDPRIAQVRDEDFVFVSGGELLLDEESLAAMKEAERRDKEQRNKDGQVHRWRVNEPRNVIGSDAARHEMTKSRSMRVELDMKLGARESASLSNSPSQQGQLRVRATKFGRLYTVSELVLIGLSIHFTYLSFRTTESRDTLCYRIPCKRLHLHMKHKYPHCHLHGILDRA